MILLGAIDYILVVFGGLPIALAIEGAHAGGKLQHGADAPQVLRNMLLSKGQSLQTYCHFSARLQKLNGRC